MFELNIFNLYLLTLKHLIMKKVMFLIMALLAFTTSNLQAQEFQEDGTVSMYSYLIGEEVEMTFGVTPISEVPLDISTMACYPCPNNYLLCCNPPEERDDTGDHLQGSDTNLPQELKIADEDIVYNETLISDLTTEQASNFCGQCAPYCCPPSDDRGDDENDW